MHRGCFSDVWWNFFTKTKFHRFSLIPASTFSINWNYLVSNVCKILYLKTHVRYRRKYSTLLSSLSIFPKPLIMFVTLRCNYRCNQGLRAKLYPDKIATKKK